MQDPTSSTGTAPAELQRTSASEPSAPIAFEVADPLLMIDKIIPEYRAPARRLRRTGYGREYFALVGEVEGLWKFQRTWKGVSSVVLCNFQGSLAYRLPTTYVDPADPYQVMDVPNLPSTATVADRARLQEVRAMFIGPFPEVVEQFLNLPDLPGQGHFPAR